MTQQLINLKSALSDIARKAILSFLKDDNFYFFSESYLEKEFKSNHKEITLDKNEEVKEYYEKYLHIIKAINNNDRSGLEKLLISYNSRFFSKIDLGDLHYYALLQNKDEILKFLKSVLPSHNINQMFLLKIINSEILAFEDRDEKSLLSSEFLSNSDKYKRSFFSIFLDEYFFYFAIGSSNLENAKKEIQGIINKNKKEIDNPALEELEKILNKKYNVKAKQLEIPKTCLQPYDTQKPSETQHTPPK